MPNIFFGMKEQKMKYRHTENKVVEGMLQVTSDPKAKFTLGITRGSESFI
jgi:hypothetical protein